MRGLDNTDINLAYALQEDGRRSNASLAEEFSISEAACWRKVKKLQTKGIIKGFQAALNRRALGFGVFAFVQLTYNQHSEEVTRKFETIILKSPYVISCHNVTGDADFLLQVTARDLEDYSQFIDTVLRKIPGIVNICSNISLREMKASNRVPKLVDSCK